MITNWGGLSSRDQSKVPSDILLDSGGPKWGYKIPLDAEPLQWLKLHLLDRKNVPSEILASSYFTKTHRQLQDAALNPTYELIKNTPQVLFLAEDDWQSAFVVGIAGQEWVQDQKLQGIILNNTAISSHTITHNKCWGLNNHKKEVVW